MIYIPLFVFVLCGVFSLFLLIKLFINSYKVTKAFKELREMIPNMTEERKKELDRWLDDWGA